MHPLNRKATRMMLNIKTLDTNNEYRNFYWWFDRIETTFDVLNTISSRGDQILKAEIIDNDQRTVLPAEAFDGSGSRCSDVIQQLEREWKEILNQPVNMRSVNKQWLISLTRSQIRNQNDRIAQLERAIETIEQRLQQVEHSYEVKSCCINLLSRYQMSLRQYQNQLHLAQSRRQLLQNQLHKLQNQ